MDDIDPHVLHPLNRFVAFVAHSRQDAALATAEEALAYCAEHGRVADEFSVLLVLCGELDPEFFAADLGRYATRLIELAVAHAEALTRVEVHTSVGPMLDALLAQVPAERRGELARRFATVRAGYHAGFTADVLLEPAIDIPLPEPMARRYRLLALAAHAPESVRDRDISVAALHDRLIRQARRLPAASGSRRMLLGEIHMLAAEAGIRLHQPRPVLAGATAMLTEAGPVLPRQHRIAAAHTILWQLRELLPAQRLGSGRLQRGRAVRAAGRVVRENLTLVYANRVIRFAAANLAELYPLVGEYVDLLAARPAAHRRAAGIIHRYQGGLVLIAYALSTDPGLRPEGFDAFIHELDNLLRYSAVGAATEDERLGRPLLARDPAPATDAEESPGRADPGYAGVTFGIRATRRDPSPVAVPAGELRASLAPDEATISLFVSERRVHAVSLTRGRPPRLATIGERAKLWPRARDLLAAIRDEDALPQLRAADFAWLHDELLGPVLSDLPPRVGKLVLAAPQLNLPLHLAYDGASKTYLTDRYDISYTHSVQVHHRQSRRHSARHGTALLLDGSDATLSHVAAEMAHIAEALAPRLRVDGPHRTFESASRVPGPAAVVHYGGHMSTDEAGERWYLHMADRSASPGELLSRVGHGTDVVSLFSCSSADRRGGSPEPVGVSAAVAAAGARWFVGCLWPIPDRTAATIAVAMYRTWASRGVSMAQALREATAPLRSKPPALWGAVVCHGPHRP
ncbi:CHAT domain-containing protein [Dactylosporangium sp. CA-092794]|uniref:CHAT domain-containing protein n=1 Tax=Dactylosporangium sp. CA-092794 TaxID=3239929 RepID=UPI003D93CEDA